MNCQHFEEILIDLVNGRVVEELLHTRAMAHSRSCRRCSARLDEESALSALLRLSDSNIVPIHIEESLLMAYRQHFPAYQPGLSLRNRIPNSVMALAASFLLMFLGAATYRLLYPLVSGNSRQSKSYTVDTTSPRAATMPREAASEDMKPSDAVPRASVPAVDPRRFASEGNSVPSEIASDFIPLTSGTEMAMMEGGQIVRVLLPRSAMAYYGLPMNQERLDTPVSAQVLIGYDGVTRAIRFLSDSKSDRIRSGRYSK